MFSEHRELESKLVDLPLCSRGTSRPMEALGLGSSIETCFCFERQSFGISKDGDLLLDLRNRCIFFFLGLSSLLLFLCHHNLIMISKPNYMLQRDYTLKNYVASIVPRTSLSLAAQENNEINPLVCTPHTQAIVL